jgi:hypothetical protein
MAVHPRRVRLRGSLEARRPEGAPAPSIRGHRYALSPLFDPLVLTSHTATSPAVRKALASPELRDLLRRLDALRGPERQDALQAALGVAPGQQAFALQGAAAAAPPSRGYAEEEMKLLRTLAEAVEGTVRGGKEEMLGLDWDA